MTQKTKGKGSSSWICRPLQLLEVKVGEKSYSHLTASPYLFWADNQLPVLDTHPSFGRLFLERKVCYVSKYGNMKETIQAQQDPNNCAY